MALDPFLISILKSFSRAHGLEDLPNDQAFERLVAYCCTSAQHPHPFVADDICPGGGHDLGLDSIAIIANGHVITSIEHWEDLTKRLRRVDVTFVLCQGKMANHFDASAIATFLEGALAFFQPPTMPENEDVADLRAIKDRVYADGAMLAARPTLALYYACAGTWKNDSHVVARTRTATDRLKETKLFQKVDFIPVDGELLRRLYADATQPAAITIEFPNHSTIPEILRVRQSYIGVIPCQEYLKLIQDDEGRMRRSVFSDNVRDYQGDNPVNKEIDATVSDQVDQQWLPLLNNGVTVVARQIQQIGTKFILQGYQIVNGCQTSYVLWTNADRIGDKVMMPLKLIESADLELTSKIIQATNRQTEVKVEAFESLRKFHRELEEYYNAMLDTSPVPLRYERRSGQYEWSDVEPRHIISLASQLKSYLAIFLEEPHSIHRYYGELLETNRERLFVEDLKDYGYYYAAAIAMFRVENMLRADSARKLFRPHIALLVRLSLGTAPTKPKDRERYTNTFLELLGDKQRFMREFNTAVRRLDHELQQWRRTPNHEIARRRDFTRSLLS